MGSDFTDEEWEKIGRAPVTVYSRGMECDVCGEEVKGCESCGYFGDEEGFKLRHFKCLRGEG